MRSYLLRATRLKMSSSKFAPVQVMACTLSRRIISASETPSSAVLIAPASVIIIFPPRSRCATYASAASFKAAALKCRKWRSMNWLMLPIFASPTFAISATRFDAKLLAWQSSLNRVFRQNFLLDRGQDLRGQDVRHHTEQKNCRGEQADCGFLENVISDQ